MKYIRTKDKIFEVNTAKPVCYNIFEKKDYYNVNGMSVFLDDVIKESYKLEDLCDVFVVQETRDNSIAQINRSLNKCKVQKGFYEDIYGAIWTEGEEGEPILKSVAKLNSEGKLELL